MDSHAKNSEVVMLYIRLFSGDELRESFHEKWKILKSKKIVQIPAFNLQFLLCGSNSNNRIKLNANKTMVFSKSLLLLYQSKSNLKNFFGGSRYIS